jgi:hypothetical protein
MSSIEGKKHVCWQAAVAAATTEVAIRRRVILTVSSAAANRHQQTNAIDWANQCSDSIHDNAIENSPLRCDRPLGGQEQRSMVRPCRLPCAVSDLVFARPLSLEYQ